MDWEQAVQTQLQSADVQIWLCHIKYTQMIGSRTSWRLCTEVTKESLKHQPYMWGRST